MYVRQTVKVWVIRFTYVKTRVFYTCKTYVAYFPVYPIMFQIQIWNYTTWCWFHINVTFSCVMIFEENILKDFLYFFFVKIDPKLFPHPLFEDHDLNKLISTLSTDASTPISQFFFKKCQHFIVYILEVRRDPSISTNSKGALCCLNFAQKLWKSCQNAKFVQTDGQPTKTY